MKFQESIADYVTYWKAGKAREEQEQYEERQIENEITNRLDEEPRGQRQAQGQAAAQGAIRPDKVRRPCQRGELNGPNLHSMQP